MEDGHSEVYDRYVRRRGTYQTSHCSVMEAFLDECEPEEVDRNYPMTLGNATKVMSDGYVRRWGIYQSNDNKSHRVKNHLGD